MAKESHTFPAWGTSASSPGTVLMGPPAPSILPTTSLKPHEVPSIHPITMADVTCAITRSRCPGIAPAAAAAAARAAAAAAAAAAPLPDPDAGGPAPAAPSPAGPVDAEPGAPAAVADEEEGGGPPAVASAAAAVAAAGAAVGAARGAAPSQGRCKKHGYWVVRGRSCAVWPLDETPPMLA